MGKREKVVGELFIRYWRSLWGSKPGRERNKNNNSSSFFNPQCQKHHRIHVTLIGL